MQFLTYIDLTKNELRNARIQNLTVAPSSPVVGQIYFDTALGFARIWDGTVWIRVDDNWVETVSVSAPITTTGSQNPTIGIVAATAVVAGSMSAADKAKLDAATSSNTASTLVFRDGSGNFSASIITATTVTGLAAPVAASDAANKAYVDGLVSGLDIHESCRAASTANIASLSGLFTLDGVILVAGNRVLVKNQTTGADNGFYVVAAGAWTRALDMDTSAETTAGVFTFIEEGTVNADTGWVLATDNPITLGVTALTFTQFSGAGSIGAGDGLYLTGTNLHVGAGFGITVNPNDVQISATYPGQASIITVGTITTGVWNGTTIAVANGGTGATTPAAARANLGATGKYAETIGDGATTTFTITHSLSTTDVLVQVYETGGSKYLVQPDIRISTSSAVIVEFATAPTSGQYRVTVVG